MRDWDSFSSDISLKHRFRNAIEELMTGSGAYTDRLESIGQHLNPLRSRDFPEELQSDFGVVENAMNEDPRVLGKVMLKIYDATFPKR